MNWSHILMVWIGIDLMRYIKYCALYSKLNGWKRPTDPCPKNVYKSLSDMLYFPKIAENTFKDIFYGQDKLEHVMRTELYDSMHRMYYKKRAYNGMIRRVIHQTKKYFYKMGINVFQGQQSQNRIRCYNDRLDSWFRPLPLILIKVMYYSLFYVYMHHLGYRHTSLENGIKIWDNGYDKMKGQSLVFFHCSVGGASLYVMMLNRLKESHNLIVVEYPGLSFYYFEGSPPMVDAVIDCVVDFIRHRADEKINIMGHSIGSILCNQLINRYPQMVDNYFCIEGLLFFYRTLKIYGDLRNGIYDQPISYSLMLPLFQRNLYAQFFIKRLICSDSFIYDLQDERSNITIHVFHAEYDQRIDIHSQIEYAELKNIPIKYHLFKDEQMDHGAFILNGRFRNDTIDEIARICRPIASSAN